MEHLQSVEDAGAPVPGGPLAGSSFSICDYEEIDKVALECLVARMGGTVRP